MMRELAKGLGDLWGQAVIPENKPGAASLIAAEAAARSAPDGLSLFLATDTPVVVLPFLGEKLPYNPLTDLKPIAMVGSIPLVLVASPRAGVRTFGEFVAMAKSRPGEINYASNGAGAGLHIAMERLQRAAGISLNHVPYKGSGPALTDMLGGQINVMWDTVPSSLPLIQAGKLIPLAMGSLQRSALLPDVPTMPEVGFPDFDVGIWMGIMGPAALPEPIVQKVQNSIQTLLQAPTSRKRLLDR
jgi:tripartite-type tricarboxylate transporter receptor subunit TctC